MPSATFVPGRLDELTGDVLLAGAAQGDSLHRGADRWQNISGLSVPLAAYGGAPSASGAANSAALQAALDALGAGGGEIRAGSGIHTFDRVGSATGDSLTQPYCAVVTAAHGPISIRGTGATTFRLAAAQTVNTSLILVRGSSGAYRLNPTLIEGIEFDGNQANQTGSWDDFGQVTFAYAKYGTIQRCYFHDARAFAAHALRDSQGFKLLYSRFDAHNGVAIGGASYIEVPHALIDGNDFFGHNSNLTASMLSLGCNADISIPGEFITCMRNTFKGGVNPLVCSGIRHSIVSKNQIHDVLNDNGVALLMETFNHATNDFDCADNLVEGNIITNCRQGIIMTALDATFGCKRNLVRGNHLSDGPGVNFVFGILMSGTSAGNVGNIIEDNVISGASVAPLTTNGVGTIRRRNIYGPVGAEKPTENGGATSVADGGTIAHGLAEAPTTVRATGTVAGEIVSVTAVGATTLTVAIKTLAGAAGTTQTVYWQAEV